MTGFIKSFRVRVFVFSAAIVSASLLIVLGLAWRSMSQYQLALLEQRMCLEARRVLSRGASWPDAIGLAEDVAEKLRLTSTDFLAMRSVSAEGEEWLRSANWPVAAEPESSVWRPFARGGGAPSDPWIGKPASRTQGALPRDRGAPLGADAWPPYPAGGRPPRGEDGSRPPGPRGRCFSAETQLQGNEWRLVKMQARGATVLIGVDSRAMQEELLGWVRPALMTLAPLALLLTALSAGLLSSLTIRPVNRMRDAMKKVTHSALDFRLDADGQDKEFGELVSAFNSMLEKLERSFVQASRFSADAAHELKTPLTILRGQIELAIQTAPNADVQHHYMGLLDEVGRLAAVSRKLLLLSQADAGHLALQLEPFDLSEALEALVADAQMMAPDRKISSRIDPGIWVNADRTLLSQLLGNLVSNAVIHGVSAAWIEVSVLQKSSCAEVRVANACAATPDEQRQRFFERFYRAHSARTCAPNAQNAGGAHADGSGLGLSLSREIAVAHGGQLTLEPSVDTVASFKLELPVLRADARL